MPDYTVGDTVYKRFTTRAFATGIPTTLAGTPVVSAYEDDSATQITAGITLGVDHDSVGGLNLLTIVATGGNGFEAGKSYDLVITTGTVGGVSVVGEVVWHFTLSAEAAAVDLANGTDGLGAIKADTAATLADTGTDGVIIAAAQTVATVTTLTGHTAQTGDSYAPLAAGIAGETRNANLLDQLKLITAMVEHQRGAHTHQPIGDIFFVDPVNGATHASGARGGITDPYSLVQDCHDNGITDSNHDMIILLSGAAAVTTLTEDVTLTKRYLFIRGPGRDFIWTRSGAGDTITITADGVELSGFQVGTAAVGSGNGVMVTSADFFRAYKLWIGNTQGHGIQLTNVDNAQILQSHFHDTGQGGSGHGLVLDAGAAQSGDNILVEDNHFHSVAGDAIRLNPTGGGTVNDAVIRRNHIAAPTGDGVDLTGSGANRAVIADNTIAGAGGSAINDNGTDTVDENNQQWAKHSIATEARLAELDAGNLPTDIAAIPTTAMRGTDDAATAANLATVDGIVDSILAILDDPRAEPGQGAPAVNANLATKIDYLYKWRRNTFDNDGSVNQYFNDAGTVVDQKETTSEAAGTVTVGEMVSGP